MYEGSIFMEEYKFDGSAYEFLGIMRWSLIAREMQKEHRKDRFDVLKDSTRLEEIADEYGMDDYDLIKELIRLTDELKNTEFYERKSLVEALLQFAQELEEKETNVENGT